MPQRTTSAAERVYAEVKERILSGQVAGGSLLGEADVATDLGVSRTPVRESFIRLEAEGWMTLYPRRGALVHEIAPRDVREVVQARLLVETGTVREAVDAGRNGELAERMAEVLDAQRAAFASDDHHRFTELDASFHHLPVEACTNRLLEAFFATLGDRQRRMAAHALWGEHERRASVLTDHDELVDAVRAGDVERFERLLGAHLRAVYDGYLDSGR